MNMRLSAVYTQATAMEISHFYLENASLWLADAEIHGGAVG